jgi:hypothetical protein
MSSLKLIKGKYEHYVRKDVPVVLNPGNPPYNIYIVYYINTLCNKNWLSWLVNQINIVKYMSPNIYIVATVPQDKEHIFRQWTFHFFPNAKVECYYENEYEYRGIKKIWELGQIYKQSDDILLYFHSKGVTYHRSYASNFRDPYNVILKDINRVKEVFTIFPTVNKIGYCTSKCGGIWYNFWYARGSYVNTLEEPVKTDLRHYYEYYITRKTNGLLEKLALYHGLYTKPLTYEQSELNSCYAFYTDKQTIGNIGSYFNADERRFDSF